MAEAAGSMTDVPILIYLIGFSQNNVNIGDQIPRSMLDDDVTS